MSMATYFTVDVRGAVWRFAALPMGWYLSPYYLCALVAMMDLDALIKQAVDVSDADYAIVTANTWADILSLEMDDSDWAVNPCTFWTLVPRQWSPSSSYVQPDDTWRAEVNWCTPKWQLLPDVVIEPWQSRAAATVLAPAYAWHGRPWLQQLTDMATHVLHSPPPPAICSIPGGAGFASGHNAGA
eukprot:jgi/Tetstr1/438872/TSEL_027381.t1